MNFIDKVQKIINHHWDIGFLLIASVLLLLNLFTSFIIIDAISLILLLISIGIALFHFVNFERDKEVGQFYTQITLLTTILVVFSLTALSLYTQFVELFPNSSNFFLDLALLAFIIVAIVFIILRRVNKDAD